MKNPSNISGLSKILLIISGLMLVISIFLPIWRIDLDAPQYPEGLRLLIYTDKLGGNVDIINGLNHYIGMKTLHTEEFIEFTVLPYIIGTFALLSVLAAIIPKKKFLYTIFTMFLLFGVIAMVDFWRWEYNYGHNLDPNAAIIVPGQAYQPPLIGFKQLLNFGAYSVPDAGGWLFISSGLLMLVAVLKESAVLKRFGKSKKAAMVTTLLMLVLLSCGDKQPEALKLNAENCEYCKMTISDGKFAAQLITPKGRVYKFDDLLCMLNYKAENEKARGSADFICDYLNPGQFMETGPAIYVAGENFNSPMGGNIAAFSNADSAAAYSEKLGGSVIMWDNINSRNY
jgi:copper chaperone NosL